MSEILTQAADRQEAVWARLRHLGMSLLPLVGFIAGAFVYDHLADLARRAAVDKPLATVAVAVEASGPTGSIAAPTHATAASAPGQPVTPTLEFPAHGSVDPAAVLRDERSLTELALSTASAVDQQPQVAERILALALDSEQSIPLGFTSTTDQARGTYAIVRGLPVSARLSHGIAVGDESWLIDGADIAHVALAVRTGSPGVVPLELTLLSGDGRVLTREKIMLSLLAAPAPPPPEAKPIESVPALVERKPEVPPTLKVAEDARLIPGRGSLLRLAVEPASAITAGAFIVLRGWPADTALSQGLPMGPDAWLLSLDELAGLEVRRPAKAAGPLMLDARLISASGTLLAELRQLVEAGDPSPAMTAVPLSAPSAGLRVAAAGAVPAAKVTASPAITRASPPPVGLTTPPPAAAKSENIGLSRGRRMLELGNIAVARPLLERAADEGSGEAAALLAASFDPSWLRNVGAVGINGDADKAKQWYDRARRLGVSDLARVVVLPAARR